MPPFGKDEQVQAIHLLNVLDCTKALAVVVSQSGGVDKLPLDSHPGVQAALKTLCEQVGKLQVYEVRARARGTVLPLTDESLTRAIKEVRDHRVLTLGERELLEATPAQLEATFSIDAPEGVTPDAAGGAEAGGDAFSI